MVRGPPRLVRRSGAAGWRIFGGSIAVGGFEGEGEGLFVADRQTVAFESAGDAGGDGAQQALELTVIP